MWGKILVSLAFLLLINCTATITCDPNLASPGCPEGHACDPTGICQKICDSGVACSDPDASICDTSARETLGLNMCQRDATAPGGCPSDQIPLNIDLSSDTGKVTKTVCKKTCTKGENIACVGPNAAIKYTCQDPTLGGSGSYCWGPPNPAPPK